WFRSWQTDQPGQKEKMFGQLRPEGFTTPSGIETRSSSVAVMNLGFTHSVKNEMLRKQAS
ncbi:MAG: hypothetical protein VX189_10350, partial [Planctomycetota bacterium]|nr:hypothetical protein [Planctomycetota bacterium]